MVMVVHEEVGFGTIDRVVDCSSCWTQHDGLIDDIGFLGPVTVGGSTRSFGMIETMVDRQ